MSPTRQQAGFPASSGCADGRELRSAAWRGPWGGWGRARREEEGTGPGPRTAALNRPSGGGRRARTGRRPHPLWADNGRASAPRFSRGRKGRPGVYWGLYISVLSTGHPNYKEVTVPRFSERNQGSEDGGGLLQIARRVRDGQGLSPGVGCGAGKGFGDSLVTTALPCGSHPPPPPGMSVLWSL